MNFFSFSEYQSEQNVFSLVQMLSDVGVPKKLFVLTALEITKSVQHLVPEDFKVSTNHCIETTEQFLRGEATAEDCRIAADAANAAADASYAAYAARAAAYAAAAYAVSAAAAVAYAAVTAAAASAAFDADIFREYLPWELVCGYQVAKVLNRSNDEDFVLQVSKNQKLVSYATMILSEPSMHQNFEFFMVEFLKNYL